MATSNPPEPPPVRTIRVSITPDGVEIESSYERDTLTRVAKLAKELWHETRTARAGLAAGMGFTTNIWIDDVGLQDPDEEDV